MGTAGANISTIPFFGRAWKLSVRYPSGDGSATTEILTQDAWDPEALRMTFDVLQSTLPSPYWFADISIYNLTKPEIQNLLLNATWVTLEAGYQAGVATSSVIWDGPVLQTTFARENVVDFKITFNCIASIPIINNNIINFNVGYASSQAQLIDRMVQEIGGGYGVIRSDKAQSLLAAKQYPRGKTCFGKVSKFLFQMADDNYLSTWMNGHQSYLSELDNGETPAESTVIVYAPPSPPGFVPANPQPNETQTIVGVPKQTVFGVILTVLLDPRLKVQVPVMFVQLNRAVIAQMKIQYGQILKPLDQNLTFVVGQIRHYGDTRGNDWHTEVTGYTRLYGQGLLKGLLIPVAGAPSPS